MAQISAILICHNEQAKISRALNSLQWTDEIIVVDSFSTDNTVNIIQTDFPHVKLFQRAFTTYADQKNWAIDQTSNSWIVILDADEWFEGGADVFIKKSVDSQDFDALRFPRINYYMNKRVRYSGWQNDSVIRLINKKKCKYNDRKIHEEIETSGKIKMAGIHIHHNTYTNLEQIIQKINIYSSLKAEEKFDKGKKSGILSILLKPLFTFYKMYILRMGILDGKIGYIICKFSAIEMFLRQIKIYRLQKGEKPDSQ